MTKTPADLKVLTGRRHGKGQGRFSRIPKRAGKPLNWLRVSNKLSLSKVVLVYGDQETEPEPDEICLKKKQRN